MALTNKTIQNLSTALAPEVAEYIFADERWVDLLHEIIPDCLSEKMGQIDNDLLYEISTCVMDKIYLTARNS